MEVTLNKNGWHWKLQKFAYNNPPRFNSLCPYFWLTVMAFIITFIIPVVPLWMVVKLFGMAIYSLFALMFSTFDKLVCRPIYKNIVLNMPETDIIKAWTCYTYDNYDDLVTMSEEDRSDFHWWKYDYTGWERITYKKKEKLTERFQVWKKANPDWQNKIREMKILAKAEYELKKQKSEEMYVQAMKDEIRDEKKKAETKARRQKMFVNIAKYTKYLAWSLVSLFIVGLLYNLIKLALWIYRSMSTITVNWNVLAIVGRVFVIACIVTGIIIMIVSIIKKCKISLGEIKWLNYIGRKIGSFLMFIINIFTGAGSGIGSAFNFLWTYFKSTKDNYCPAIIWKEEEELKKK